MWWYNTGIRLYSGAIKIASCFKPKARLWVEGRRNIFQRMASGISSSDRIVWVHCSSLGEFEQGRPIIEALQREHPEYKILLTFFSPSGYEIRRNYPGADYIFYLPADTPGNVKRFLDIAHPEIAIFVKYEFWLNYLSELQGRKCRSFVVSAIFRKNSIFFRSYGKQFRKALSGFERIFVQDHASARLLEAAGYANVTVAGDTRFDRVAEIVAAAKQLPVVSNFIGKQPVLVAGSTWQPDEELLLRLVNSTPDMKFIIAPHEMDQGRIEMLLKNTRGGAVRYTACNDQTDTLAARLMIIDTIGILSSVYRYASYAYIGGGFGVGIHNTLEAAAYGLPLAFGPNYHKFKEARDLIGAGAARSITSYEELEKWLGELRSDTELYESESADSKAYVAEHTGATRIILDCIFRP